LYGQITPPPGGGGGGGGAGDLNQGGSVNAGNNVVAGANGVSVATATYTSGGTWGTGACTLTISGGTTNAVFTYTASGTAPAVGTAFQISAGGTGFTSNPATATLGGACSGIATISTTLTPGCVHMADGVGNDEVICAPANFGASQTYTLPISPYYNTPAIITANYGPPVMKFNYFRCNATSGNVVITLPPLVGGWRYLTIKRIDNTFATAGFTCSVVPSGSDTISDGAASLVLTQNNSTVTLVDVPTGPTTYVWQRQNVGSGTTQLVSYCTGAVSTVTSGDWYLNPAGNGGSACSTGANTNSQGVPMPYSCAAKNFFVVVNSHAAGGLSVTYTLRKNGIATTITCPMAAGVTTCSDNTDTIGFGAGDQWSVSYNLSALTDNTNNIRAVFQCTQQ
jgi:hypothetical protein